MLGKSSVILCNRFIYTESFSKDNNALERRSLLPKVNENLEPFLLMSINGDENNNLHHFINLCQSIFMNLPFQKDEYGKKIYTVTVGIILLTNEQKKLSEETFDEISKNVKVYNFDNLKSIEKDIIVIGLIDKSDITYLKLNIAMTRARKALYIAGHSKFFDTSVNFLNYCNFSISNKISHTLYTQINSNIKYQRWNKLIRYAKKNNQLKTVTSVSDYVQIKKMISKSHETEEEEFW